MAEAPPHAPVEEASMRGGEATRVLVVDDDPVTRRTVELTLLKCGYAGEIALSLSLPLRRREGAT